MEENEATGLAGQLDDDELAAWIRGKLRESKSRLADWRRDAAEEFDFYAGHQWTDEDIAILEEQRRVPVVFNRTSRTINAVVGIEISNRQEVRFLPRETQDTGFNEMLNEASKWVRDGCDAENEETEAFRDMAVCGMGWTETHLDYETDPDGQIIIERVDPLEMFWDCSSTKKNLRDARWVARVKKMSKDAVQEMWPDYEGHDLGEEWLDDKDEPHDASPPYYDEEEKDSVPTKSIEVVHFQWYERETFHRVLTTGGQIIELSHVKWERLKDRIEGMGLRHVEQKRRVYKCAYLIGSKVYEKRDNESQEGFTFKAMTAMRDRNRHSWFGLIRIMRDPQKWANKWLSQMLHIMNSNAKGGLLAELGAFVDPRKAETDWPKSDSILWLENGGLTKIQERAMAQFPAGFANLMQIAVEAIHDTPGVNQELMGLVGHEQAGVLESMRKSAGVTLLAFMFDALQLYRKDQGRVLAEFIREYISDGRLIRVVGDDGARYVPLLRDAVSFKYDVVVDEAPTSHNQKERVLMILQHILPTMVGAGMPPPPPEILEYLPLPENIMERWRQAAKPDPQQVMAQQQAAQEARQVELAERTAKARLDEARAMKERVEAQKLSEADNSEALKDVLIAREKANIESATDIEVARIRAQTQAMIEQMKLQASVPDAPIVDNLRRFAEQMQMQQQAVDAALRAIAETATNAQNAVNNLLEPKPKQFKFIRDENGDLAGAEIIDLASGRRKSVSVTRGQAGEMDGASILEA